MKIVIIGAGLGGLTATFRLAKSGHDVVTFERAPKLGSTGGGISMRPSASKVLRRWALQDDLEAICDTSPSVTHRDMYTGKVINRILEPPENADFGTTRRAMIKLLYRHAIKAGAQIRFSANVVRVFDDETHAVAVLENGEEISGDIILAADGIKSHARRAVLSEFGPHEQWDPIMDLSTFYSIDLKVKDRSEYKTVLENEDINTWFGNGGYVVSRYSSKFHKVGIIYAIYEKTDQKSLWDENGDIEYVRKYFSNTCDDLTKALQQVNSCTRWRLAHVPNLPRWSSKQGRIVLLGDSASAQHPNSASGFSVIIEEVDVLDHLLKSRFSVPKIVEIWQRISKPRVERVKEFSGYNTKRLTGRLPADTAAGKEGRGMVGKDIVPDKDAPFSSAEFWKWNSDYDPLKETEAYLANLEQPKAKL